MTAGEGSSPRPPTRRRFLQVGLGAIALSRFAPSAALAAASLRAADDRVLVVLELTGGLVGGALLAFLATAELGAITAIDAGDRGALPPPPVPAALPKPQVESEPILATEVVLTTEPR